MEITDAGKRRRLGRGLSSLIGESVTIDITQTGDIHSGEVGRQDLSIAEAVAKAVAAASEQAAIDPRDRIQKLPVGALVPSRFQPRRVFDDAALERLAASIRTAGVMQPVVVRKSRGSGAATGYGDWKGVGEQQYELVAGERRWRAAKLAGLVVVPAVVADLSDAEAAQFALIENLQREDLGPMERAWAMKGLVDRFGLTHAEVAEKVGVERSTVTNLVRLTELEAEVTELLEKGELNFGHGKALLTMAPGKARVETALRAAREGWSVRRLEESASVKPTAGATSAAVVESAGADAERKAGLRELEKQLGEHLGTRVRIVTGAGGARGKLTIEFFDLDHFDGLMAKLGFEMR
jgi:ParB family chromosome partitioning protein